MAVSFFKGKGYGDRDCAQLLISRFPGMLKNWWDNFPSQEERNYILTATKQVTADFASSSTTQVTNQEVVMISCKPDSIATLIYTVCKHFIGDPNKLQDIFFN